MNASPKYQPIMVVGTGSHVGKSVLVMGLCRAFKRRGLDVAPFKAQNMALNSGITPEGAEIGRAQIAQAEAAGLEPHVDMNPILLKPTSDQGSQVILEGKALGNFRGAEYFRLKPKLVKQVMAAYGRLHSAHQLVVMEGAGSCAEMNLRKKDLVNLPMARRAGAKVILAADIDVGGVFAQVVGTIRLITPSERRMMAGVVINKFRGDPDLFTDGIEYLERKTKLPVLGVMPYFNHISLPQEDGVVLERGGGNSLGGRVRVGVVRLSRISNFTDVDALAAEEAVDLRWVTGPEQLAGLDLLILPGTKNTLAALAGLYKSGLFEAIGRFHQLGGKVLGLCGGYQLMGAKVADPLGVEGPPGEQPGLGLLDIQTVMASDKTTTRVQAEPGGALPFEAGELVRGYEIHMGESHSLGEDRPAFRLVSRLGEAVSLNDGQVSRDGRAVGSYLHGLLDNDQLRASLLAWAWGGEGLETGSGFQEFKDSQYDLLADLMEQHLDLDTLLTPLEQ